jgi:BirA family transcriptional regulator, biotin operon repressor / biotin---[acetyl-CoA-carboxylase] ligase
MPGARRVTESESGELPRQTSRVAGWVVNEYESVPSTNLIAANLPAWHAVRADVQTAGRGRFQRSWVSDQGGLWLSAVVPAEPPWRNWGALPLAAGLAVCDALVSFGVPHLRLRWPNDVLADDRKMVGVLVDRFSPKLAVAGIGINVNNNPEASDSSLRGGTARLADLVPNAPSLDQLCEAVLGKMAAVIGEMQAGGFQTLLPRVNELWRGPRQVELDLDGRLLTGIFKGIDSAGRLIIEEQSGIHACDAHQVKHLTEISTPL